MIGNLTVNEIEARIGVIFPEELKQLMESTYQHDAENITEGKWHCFDIPFTIVCGGMPLAQKIFDYLKADSASFKECMEIIAIT